MANLDFDPNQPTDVQAINQKLKMAEALRQQSQPDLQGQMVSNHYVAPSITQHLSRLLNAYQSGKMTNDANTQGKDYQTQKAAALAELLRGNQPQPTGIAPPPAAPMDKPMGGMQPIAQPQMQPQQTAPIQPNGQASILEYMNKYGNSPEAQVLLADYNHQRDRRERTADIADTRNYEGTTHARDRGERVQDIGDQRRYEDIVRKDAQGFQVSQQDRQFAQQFQMQKQSQGFSAGQQSRSQAFQAGQNALNRDQQLNLAGMKTGAAGPQTKINDAKDVLQILQQAAPLINKSTGSGLGNMVDESAAFLGRTTSGAQAAAQLKALEGSLVSKMPKMSGPQSDKDVLLYKQMAGQIGDPRIPPEQKQAAMNTINELNSRYAGVPVSPLNYQGAKSNPIQDVFGGQPQSGGWSITPVGQ